MTTKKRQSTIQPIILNTDLDTETGEEAAYPEAPPTAPGRAARPSTIRPLVLGPLSTDEGEGMPSRSGTYLDTSSNPAPIGGRSASQNNGLDEDDLRRPLAKKEGRRNRSIQAGIPVVTIPEKKPKKPQQTDSVEPVISFRGIPPDTKQRVHEIAAELTCPVGIAARLLLAYGIQAYQQGELQLVAKISWIGPTLYPQSGKKLGRPVNSDRGKGAPARSAKKKNPSNIVSFRGISHQMHQTIIQIAREVGEVPVGDVARYFLEFGIDLYNRGEIAMTPEQLLEWSKETS